MCVLLDMMSMCIAGFHPPAPPARRDRASGMMGPGHDLYDEDDEEDEEDQLLWREKLKELLESKVPHDQRVGWSGVGVTGLPVVFPLEGARPAHRRFCCCGCVLVVAVFS